MAIPTYTTVIERFFIEVLDPILHNYVFNGYSSLANHLKAPLGTAVILFITLLGLSISQGWVKMSMANFIKAAIKIGLIYSFAMNWGYFSQWVIEGIQLSAGQIGNWLSQATPLSLPHTSGSGINNAMQLVLIEVTKVGNWIWNMGSWHNMSPYLTALMIWGFGFTLVLIGIFEIVLAKIMLAVLFATAPLFISFTLFKPTRSFFDRWLGAIVGNAFLLIFVSAVLGLALSFVQWAIADTYANRVLDVHLVGFIPLMIVGFIGIGIILKMAHLAHSIGGGVCTASGAELLAGTVGGFIGGSLSPVHLTSKGLDGVKKMTGVYAGLKGTGHALGASAINRGSTVMSGIRSRMRGG